MFPRRWIHRLLLRTHHGRTVAGSLPLRISEGSLQGGLSSACVCSGCWTMLRTCFLWRLSARELVDLTPFVLDSWTLDSIPLIACLLLLKGSRNGWGKGRIWRARRAAFDGSRGLKKNEGKKGANEQVRRLTRAVKNGEPFLSFGLKICIELEYGVGVYRVILGSIDSGQWTLSV